MTAPTQVWVVLQKDREGKARGFEKSPDCVHHLTPEDAAKELGKCPLWLQPALTVQECVIMGVEEYEHLAGVR